MSDDLLERIAGWCADEPDLEFGDGEIVLSGDPPLHINLSTDEDRVLLSHPHVGPAGSEDFAEAARRQLTRRGSMVRGAVDVSDDATTTTVEYPVFRDGISRQTFLLAVRDIAGTIEALDEAASLAEAASSTDEPTDTAATAAAAPESAEVAAPIEPTEEILAPSIAQDAEAPWAPTHAVPGSGMDAWAEPDPSQAPVANLHARVELRVDEMRGAWAHVTGSNGWTGWVDGRRLLPLGGTPAAAAGSGGGAGFGVVSLGSFTVRILPLLGGLAIIISVFLDWLRATGLKSLDFPLAVLWRQPSPDHPRLGLILLVLGIAAVALAFVPRIPTLAYVLIGTAAAACPIIYLIQLATSSGVGFSTALDALGAGFWTAFAGGVVANVGGRTTGGSATG